MFGLTTPTLSLFDTFRNLDAQFEESAAFPTDILDLGNAYRIDTELPGFTREEIKVSLEGKHLTLSAKKASDKPEEGIRYLSRQRKARSFVKTFSLSGVDAAAITVKLENGILFITLPKMAPQKPEVTEFPIA